MKKKYDNKDLKILLINMKQDRNTVASFIQRKKHSNRVLLDTDGETAKKYRVVGIPLSFIIDKQGIIVEKLVGEVDWKSSHI
ncbi:MAG: TlpA family protein disulfide reductase, partial [Desulfofustis sp.]|nr:TlpA family protein disulfide reductase [Desulfofustis sp.]